MAPYMSNEKKDGLLNWIKSNILQLLIFAGIVGNLYLTNNFVTKTEFESHVAKNEQVYSTIDMSLNKLALSISKLDYMYTSLESNSKQISINTIKLADHEARLKNVESSVSR